MRRLSILAICVMSAVIAAGAGAGIARAQDAAPGAGTPAEARGDRQFADDDYEGAEASYREALRDRPGSLHAMSRLALLLTWRGAYREAIALYRSALAIDPASMETRRGLATALTWSEDYRGAIALYREMLAQRPGDEGLMMGLAQAQAWSGDFADATRTLNEITGRNPKHREARTLLAQSLYWDGRTDASAEVWSGLVADDPGDARALAGLGRARTAQGRYQEALDLFDRAIAIDPSSREALEGRAEAYHWQGRQPEALAAVRQALDLYPDARDARRLGRDIGGPLRPSLQLFGTTTQDSDDNDLATWGGIYTHHLGAKGYVGLTFTHAQTDDLGVVARYDTLRIMAGRHFSRYFSLYAEAGSERTSFPFTDASGDHDNETRGHGAGSLAFEVNGGDWFTLVGSASADRLVGTTDAFVNDIGIRAATLTTIFRPHDTLVLRVMGQKAELTDDSPADLASNAGTPEVDDDNGRDLVTAGASWRIPLRRPLVHLNYGFRWMSYDMTLDHGYFDPDHFVSNTAGFDISDTIGRHLYWGGGMDYGYQRIDDGDDDDVLSYRILAGVNIADSASIEAYYSRSQLALQSAAGFGSSEAGVRIRIRFGQPLGPAAPRAGGGDDNGR